MFGALIRARVCIHTYSTFMTVAGGEERRTGVSPGEAAHHCSAQGRRASLANIIPNIPEISKRSPNYNRHSSYTENKIRKLSYRRFDSLSACLWWTAASDNIVVNTEAPPGKPPSVKSPQTYATILPVIPFKIISGTADCKSKKLFSLQDSGAVRLSY